MDGRAYDGRNGTETPNAPDGPVAPIAYAVATMAARAKTTVVDWPRLSHAYGKADDVPALLRGLGSPAAATRRASLARLAASVCHQGTLYGATAPAVRAVVELLRSPRTKDAARLLAFLADVATLDDAPELEGPRAADAARAGLPRTYARALREVDEGRDVYLARLGDRSADVRAAAAYLLVWLPDRSSARAAIGEALLRERDPGAKAALALAAAETAGREGARATARELAPLLVDHGRGERTSPRRAPGADPSAAVRAAAAIAIARLGDWRSAGAEVARAARTPRLAVDRLPWLGGDLARFATHTLAAAPDGDDVRDALLDVAEAGGGAAPIAAAALVPRLLGRPRGAAAPKRAKAAPRDERRDRAEEARLAAVARDLASLDDRQRRLLAAIARLDEGDARGAYVDLERRGLPGTRALLERWLSGSPAPAPSILDREVTVRGARTTLEALYVAAIAGNEPKPAVVADIAAAIGPGEQLELALAGIVEIDRSWAAAVGLDLAWRSGPGAGATLDAAAARLAAEGIPTRTTPEARYEFPMVAVAIGVALAARAIDRGEPAPEGVDAMLQRAYGFWPRVRDALGALPVRRREAWLLHPDRDNQAQPAEHFLGAWPYWLACPTPTIAARALAHVAGWKPKDPWGGARARWADPHLDALVAALRAAGQDAAARRLEDARAARR